MSILRKTLVVCGFLVVSADAIAEQSKTPNTGDTYIISRDGNHTFRGSHKIYKRNSTGLVEVQYCGQPYFVRYATVAWTELEVQFGNAVRVEFNQGKGWRPICNSPEEQVTLLGLGISEDPRVVAQDGGFAINPVNRFAAIRDAFHAKKLKSSKTSYHSAD